MADDARSQFVPGLLVTADHLQHLQDRLRESLLDLRRTVGLGHIGWGLVVRVADGQLLLEPGVALSPGGVRLALDTAVGLGGAPLPGQRVVLRATNSDRAALRVGNTPTLVNLLTTATREVDDGSDVGPDALVIARIIDSGGNPTVQQDAALFVAAGTHTHSGEHRQDAQGRWHFDGATLAGGVGGVGPAGPAGPPGLAGPTGEPGAAGAVGDIGPAGPVGPAGPAGEPGLQGPAGPAGETGPTGATGPAGEPGAEGPAGPTGATGPAGLSGEAAAQGQTGPAGEQGPIGPEGPQGPAGTAGLDGAVGPAGPQGAQGPAGADGAQGAGGPEGPIGAAGPEGPQGPAGSAGPEGPQGPIGATGPEGPQGPAGATGPEGPPGPAGSAGAEGPQGATGSTGLEGPSGAQGATGERGEPGPAGVPGTPGTPGATGEPGAAGTAGAAGPAGPRGEQGPAGDIATLDWPFIEKTNWPQGATLRATDAYARLGKLTLNLSSPLNGRTTESQPKVVQVWFEPMPAQSLVAVIAMSPTTLLAFHGDQKLSGREVVWAIADERERTVRLLQSAGRIMLRVHCGHLVDEKDRSFSSSVDALVGAKSPHLPAGVFEGWFFVVADTTILGPGRIVRGAPAKKVAARKRVR